MSKETYNGVPLEKLVVCPVCDAVWQLEKPKPGQRARCARCGEVLIAPRRKAGLQIIAVAVTVVILLMAATVLPFLRISAGGRENAVSILDAALSFSEGWMIVLALMTASMIIFLPMLRMLLLLYVLVPMVLDKPAARGATLAFRWAEGLRPWSMAEIFAIGCAVALVKITDLALVDFGPAFWLFGALVVLVVIQDTFLCRWSVWDALEHRGK